MACGGCKERAEILRAELPKVRSLSDMADLTKKIVATYGVRQPEQPWMSPPSINKDGTPYRKDENK